MNNDRSQHNKKKNVRPTTHEKNNTQKHNSLTKYSTSKVSQADKIAQLSLKVMGHVSRYQQPQSQLRIITRQTIREGGSRLFYDVFAMLGRVLDDRMEANNLNPQSVMNILQFLRYPGYLNKTIFQPIGAPHTWLHFLNMLDFMGEVANYAGAFKAHCQTVEKRQVPPEGDSCYLERKAVLQNDEEILTSVLTRQQADFERKAEEMNRQKIEIDEQIQRLNEKQPSLETIEAGIEEERKQMAKFEADIASKERDQERLEGNIAKAKDDISKNQTEIVQLDLQLEHLTYRLENNELTEAETVKLHQEVKQQKIQHRTLENQLHATQVRIRQGLRKNIGTLRQSYHRVHTCLTQINSLSIDGQLLGQPVPFVDNFNQIQDLCCDFLNTEDIKQGNLRIQFQELASQWEIPNHSSKAYRINQQISQKVKGKQRTRMNLQRDIERLLKQNERLNQQYEVVQRMHSTCTREVQDQILRSQNMHVQLQRATSQKASLDNDIRVLFKQRVDYQAQTQLIMDEIDKVTADSEAFERRMIEEINSLEKLVQETATNTMDQLENFKEEIIEVYHKSGQRQLMDEVLQQLEPFYGHLMKQQG